MHPARPRAGAVSALLLLALTLVFATGCGHHRKAPPAALVVRVDGVDRDTRADDTLKLSPKAVKLLGKVDDTAQFSTPEVEKLKSEGTTLPGAELADPLKQFGDVPKPIPGPLAAQDWPGCRTQFVQNKSYRSPGVKVQGIFLHYTVSADTPGWADNDALTARANSLAAGVSWHFQIGRKDGNCTYNVPISMKAWHAAGANSATVGIEIHATGHEDSYVEGAGKARLLQVVREIQRREGIPDQIGQGHCFGQTFVITRPGLFRHVDGGLCSGGHVDTNPFPDPRPMVVAGVRALAKPKPKITAADRRACKAINAYRARRHRHLKPTTAGTKRFKARLARVRSHHVRCVDGHAKLR